MIVDTSALIAAFLGERSAPTLLGVLASEAGLLPAPAYVEFCRVVSRKSGVATADGEAFLHTLLDGTLRLLSFSVEHAHAATEANARYGIGNVRGGTLNMLDLMVYGCAAVERMPILCTGRDFAATDAVLHPASRAG